MPSTDPRLRELIGPEAIRARIGELAIEIEQAVEARPVVLLGVLKGGVHFLSDLARAMSSDPRIEFIRVRTYATGTDAAPESTVIDLGLADLAGEHVVVVDDVLDQGKTALALASTLAPLKLASLRWVFLLVKEGARERSGVRPDFVGFEIRDEWVVGYGLDLDERFRNLSGVYVWHR